MYQRIRDLREDRDLTQKNMGEILNCSQRIYSNYECGDVDIPTHILIKLAEFHNTSVDYLLVRFILCKPDCFSFLQTAKNYPQNPVLHPYQLLSPSPDYLLRSLHPFSPLLVFCPTD